jgi:hypothetical protein
MEMIYKIISVNIVSLSILATTGMGLQAQTSPFDSAVFRDAALIREHVDCFTDRSLYITGEVIRFRANVHCTGNPLDREWSSVLYVELLSATGGRGVYGKFPIHDQVSIGEIAIPAGILTGNYFLRCYTRWMRNRGPEEYSYIPLRIINPERPELSGEIPSGDTGASLSNQFVREDVLEFSDHPTNYNRGDTITLGLFTAESDFYGMAEGCITVVPVGVKPADPTQIAGLQRESLNSFQVKFLPDLFGATISGIVFKPGVEQQIEQDARIHITLIGDQQDYLVTHSDSYGRFSITLPYREGKLKLLVQSENPDTGRVEVKIDQDFDQRNLLIQTGPFNLNKEEEQMVTVMARKVQLSRIYQQTDSTQMKRTENMRVPFYGSPTFSVNMDEFILLPTLEEVFINLVPGVIPVTRKNRTSLLIRSKNPSISIYDPLIMIDEVPVFNIDKFMSVHTDKISRIDVIEDVYLKGDIRFGGIINLYSKEKDMAGIDLPGNSFFIDCLAMHSPPSVVEEIVSQYDRMPDTRNTLLWIPQLQVKRDIVSWISFIAPDYPGEYVVLFRGLDMLGELISAESTIHIQ